MTTTRTALLAIALAALWHGDLWGQSIGKDLPTGFRSLAGVTLDRDSAATILAKLGHTREQQVGAGHDTYIDWCYVTAEASPALPALLELMSDASDMGTAGRELNVIRLRANASPTARAGCAPLRTSAALSTPAGLRLGLRSRAVENLLGRPARRHADSLVYYFNAKEFLRPESPEYEVWDTAEYRESCFDAGPPYANVGAAVIVVLRDDRAAEIRIERYDRSVC